MEIRIYRSLECRATNKVLFAARIGCPDAFSFEKSMDVFRSIYGFDIVIEFLIV